jgi:pimeloyl-ACP methyl ester carboxylesterase
MYVRDLGSGPPVVLLHPGPGLDGSVFLPAAEALAEHHRVLLVDLPGNGRSPDGDRNDWSLAGFARAVERLARELDLRDWWALPVRGGV